MFFKPILKTVLSNQPIPNMKNLLSGRRTQEVGLVQDYQVGTAIINWLVRKVLVEALVLEPALHLPAHFEQSLTFDLPDSLGAQTGLASNLLQRECLFSFGLLHHL